MRSLFDRAMAWLFGQVDGVRIVAFRLLFAHALLVYVLFRWRHAEEWLTPLGYHPTGAVTGGAQRPVPLLSPEALPWFGVAYLGSIAALILGIRPRVTIWLVFAGTLYVTLADRLAAFTINKLFVATLLILALAPPIAERDGRLRMRSAWPLRALQATLVIQLFGAGVCKLRYGPWIERGDTLWHQVQLTFMTDIAAWMVRELPMWLWALLQHFALAFELLAPLLLIVKRLRPLGYLLGFGMFTIIALTMYELIFFSLQMCTFFVLFVDSDRLERLRSAIARRLA